MNRKTTQGGAFALLSALTLLSSVSVTVAHADAKGETILRAAFKKLKDANAMTATLVQSTKFEGLDRPIERKVTVSALKPNYLIVRMTGTDPDGQSFETVNAATGKEYITYSSRADGNDGKPLYNVVAEKPNPTDFGGAWEAEVDAFFGGEALLAKGTPEFSKVEKVGKVSCDVIKMNLKAVDGNPARTITYFVGQKDKTIYRSSWVVEQEAQGQIFKGEQSNILTDINLKAEKKPADFNYTPPTNAKKFVEKKKREVVLILAKSSPKS